MKLLNKVTSSTRKAVLVLMGMLNDFLAKSGVEVWRQ